MRLNKNNIFYHELIGLFVEVLSHSDPTLVGRRGLIVDETLNTIVIVDSKSRKLVRIPKHYGVFQFFLPSNVWVTIDGTLLYGRPEDRLKKMGK